MLQEKRSRLEFGVEAAKGATLRNRQPMVTRIFCFENYLAALSIDPAMAVVFG